MFRESRLQLQAKGAVGCFEAHLKEMAVGPKTIVILRVSSTWTGAVKHELPQGAMMECWTASPSMRIKKPESKAVEDRSTRGARGR